MDKSDYLPSDNFGGFARRMLDRIVLEIRPLVSSYPRLRAFNSGRAASLYSKIVFSQIEKEVVDFFECF